MRLTYRRGERNDFLGFYRSLFPHHQYDSELKAIVQQEWDVILVNPTTLCMVVEDMERVMPTRIVGCAQTVFVNSAFVRLAKSGEAPYPIQHLSKTLPDGSRPLLTLQQVRTANSGEGLNAFTTRWGWDNTLLSEEQLQIREYMVERYPLFYKGYRYKETIIQATGEWHCESLERAGYKLRTDYADYYKLQLKQPSAKQRPYLLGLTQEEAHQQEGSYASRIFVYSPPIFWFKPIHQKLLEMTLQGLSEDEAAIQLNISRNAVKKRWTHIYDLVDLKMPAWLPTNEGEKRGQEKRRLLLNYLREHPEELRPIT